MAHQIKIRDKRGNIYTTPEEVTSIVSKDISASTTIKQPNVFIDMRSAYSYIQFYALFRIIVSLQPLINKNFGKSKEAISLEAANVRWNRDLHEVEVVLQLRDFGIKPSHYEDLEEALRAMSSIHVTFLKQSQFLQGNLLATGGLCAVALDKRRKRHYTAHFFFHEQIVQAIVNPQFGYSHILQETIEKLSSVYTAKLYFMICRKASEGRWIITYEELREFLNIAPEKYVTYNDFRKRILKSSAEQLMNVTNYWFVFYERFPRKSKTPDKIYFIIQNGMLEQQVKKDHDNRIARISDMGGYYGVSLRTMQSILSHVTPCNSQYVYERHVALVSYIEEPTIAITNKATFYIKSLKNIIYFNLLKETDTQAEFNFSYPSN